MRAPQILWILVIAIGLGTSFAQRGKERTGKEKVWPSLVSVGIHVTLLWWGGFFG